MVIGAYIGILIPRNICDYKININVNYVELYVYLTFRKVATSKHPLHRVVYFISKTVDYVLFKTHQQ